VAQQLHLLAVAVVLMVLLVAPMMVVLAVEALLAAHKLVVQERLAKVLLEVQVAQEMQMQLFPVLAVVGQVQ
jgi:hypothetical protein